MKHIECTDWCLDTDEICEIVPVSFNYRKLFELGEHIDSQKRDEGVRIQFVISADRFKTFLNSYGHYEGLIKGRDKDEYILTFFIENPYKNK